MVVVLIHIAASVYLYYRHWRLYLKSVSIHKPMSPTMPMKKTLRKADTRADPIDGGSQATAWDAEQIQNCIISLSAVTSLTYLETATCSALEKLLPDVAHAIVYLRLADNSELQCVHCTCMRHTLPMEGISWEAVHSRKRLIIDQLSAADPIAGLLNSSLSENRKYSQVVCSPVVDSETNIVVAVLVVMCGPLQKASHQHLNFFEKQLLTCYKRLKQAAISPSRSHPDVSHHSDEHADSQLILNLCADLDDEDPALLQLKLLKHLIKRTHAQSGFLMLLDHLHNEIVCRVIGDKVLAKEQRFKMSDSCYMKAISTKKPLMLSDLPSSSHHDLENELNSKVNSLLCVPLCNRVSQQVAALACLVNKTDADNFSVEDVHTVLHCFKYTWTVLHSALAMQNEVLAREQTQTLLRVAKNLFRHLDDLTKLLQEIMQEARNLTDAERCSVFLWERDSNELVATVFDGDISYTNKTRKEVRIPVTQGIAGRVATTGQILTIEDAYSHPLFYRKVDELTGFKTRNILCFPIKDQNDHSVIAVAQLCNKMNGEQFTRFDEELAQTFAVYCSISISNSLLYKKVDDAQHRSSLSNELMIYHMRVTNDEVAALMKEPIPKPNHFGNMSAFEFTPRSLLYNDTTVAVLSMCEDMGFISHFRIKKESLCKFVLMVRRGYRNPPYHNWGHAFAVAHFCYLMYKRLNLHEHLDKLEIMALFIACLCHDIDHRGTTNSYQIASESVLAALYSSEGSVMERHHLTQTMCILNTDGCNIFSSLSKKEYQTILDLISYIILATDIAHHLAIVDDIAKMVQEGYNNNRADHRKLLICLAMTSCDLSDQTKSWPVAKHIASLIYKEFFSQGDLEKRLGRKPITMMDRERACIPELQIGFLDNIAMPVFTLLTGVLPEAAPILDVMRVNREKWEEMNEEIKTSNEAAAKSSDIHLLLLEENTATTPQAAAASATAGPVPETETVVMSEDEVS